MTSPAFDAVSAADHPSHDEGGPCHGCAFRKGTEASHTAHTVELAKMCVEGLTLFKCHEHPGPCRGWIAAVNLRGAPTTDDDRKWAEVNALGADVLAQAISAAAQEDRAHG